jgi:hypothetical protein
MKYVLANIEGKKLLRMSYWSGQKWVRYAYLAEQYSEEDAVILAERWLNCLILEVPGSEKPIPTVFSGDASSCMWEGINGARSISDVRMAMYTIGCRLQEFEHIVRPEADGVFEEGEE